MKSEKTGSFGMGEKAIETPSLLIKKNIMTWGNTMIQLSNVSYISSVNRNVLSFPVLTLLMILLGFVFIKSITVLALVLLVAAGAWIYFWYQENEKRKAGAVLTIRMNSGHNLYFTFENKLFLNEVVGALEQIIIDGGANSPISINIKDCTITGSKVLSDIHT